jgi:CSLREA domain-containing protein
MMNGTFRFLVLAALVAGLFAPSKTAYGASLTVNSLADTIAADGFCTLREAIQNAENNAATNPDCAAGSGADTITFTESGTITLASYLGPFGDKAGLTIDGSGQSITIDGNNLADIGTVSGLASLTLNHLTITNATPGFYNSGILTITNSVFSNNHGGAYGGGAIYNQSATLIIDNTTFSGNTAVTSGGALYSLSGNVTITNSTFTDNTASAGGGIYCYDCILNVSHSTFSNNNTPNGSGGGIYHIYNSVTISDSIFTNNGASYGGGGGGVFSSSGGLTLTNSSFSNNSANGSPGGAIHIEGTINISQSTFSNNSAGSGGGIYDGSSVYAISTIANSTFSGNSASDSPGNGGGIYNTGNLTITNSTFSGNNATGNGGGIANSGNAMSLRNTIVANNTGGNCSGTIFNGASNLDDGTTCNWGTAKGSMSGVNPLLGALTGAPAFFPLSAGSPAIDKGDDSICAAAPVNNQSQNGATRPQGAHCDIGSFEAGDITPPVVQSITRTDANPTRANTVHFTVVFSKPVTGVDASDFALTVSGVIGAAITGVSGTAATYMVTVAIGSGIGTIRLDVVDDDSIVDATQNPLGGVGAGNGNYSGGESYLVRPYPFYLPMIRR